MNQKFLTGQAVILAAGESSRFWPLNQKHKSLFKIMGRPLICGLIEGLKKSGVKEIIIIQSSRKDVEAELKNYSFPGATIKYAVQKKLLGTGDALLQAKRHLKNRFLVLNGDDLYEKEDLKKCLTKFPSLLVKEMKNVSGFGVIAPEKNYVKRIVEKSQNPPSNLANMGVYFLDKSVFQEKLEKSKRGEYEIIDYISKLTQKTKVHFLKAKTWIPFSFVWDLLFVNEHLLKDIKTKISGRIEKNCQIKGSVIVERGTVVKSGSYIEGPVYIGKNCQIGPNCYIKSFSSVGDNCRIGQSVEIKNSIVSQNTFIPHLSYVGDSVLGENCNLGAGTILANLRFDGKNVKALVKGELIDTGRQKFGAVLGSGTKTGINVSIMPGVLVGSNCQIGPHSAVFENVADNTAFYAKFQNALKKRDGKIKN